MQKSLSALALLWLLTFTIPSMSASPTPAAESKLKPTPLTRSVTGKPADQDSEIGEVLFTTDFIDFSGLDQFPSDVVTWDKSSGKFLYTSKGENPPFVFLAGAVKYGYEISLDDAWIDVIDGRFEAKVYLPLEPRVLTLKVFDPKRNLKLYRFTYFWLRPPPEVRFKGQRKLASTPPMVAFTQLYAGATPIGTVDLDSQKYADLTFRLYQMSEPDAVYDNWSFLIRNNKGEVVAETNRQGSPPEFLEWKDVASEIQTRGSYRYQLALSKNGQRYEGPVNTFDTVEGLSLLQHKYSPKIVFEPKEEIGWFSYQDATTSYSNVYLGADLSLSYLNRFIVRGAGNVSLHKLDPDSIYTYTRLGAGMRFHGQGSNSLLGDPYMYRLDILINYSAFTLRPSALVPRMTQASILVEPHVVIRGYHYIVPWFEYGLKSELSQQRLSLGLSYYFFIRPWSVKLGLGVAYDSLMQSDLEATKFSLLRAMTNFVFYL